MSTYGGMAARRSRTGPDRLAVRWAVILLVAALAGLAAGSTAGIGVFFAVAGAVHAMLA
jgi:hypothetical protein